jgi:hypothetical protein
MKQKIIKEGYTIDLNIAKTIAVMVIFIIFFVTPTIGYDYYQSLSSANDRVVIEETYTQKALDEIAQDETNREGRVAGINVQRVTDQSGFRLPILNITIGTDFTKPANLMFLIGGILAISSFIILIRLFVDNEHI